METEGDANERVSPTLVDLSVLLRQLEHERKWDRRTSNAMTSLSSDTVATAASWKTQPARDNLQDACEQIRDVFTRIDVALAASESMRARNKSRVSRWHAVQGALGFSWRFAAITSSANDVDEKQFPFELVRCQPLGPSDEKEQDLEAADKGRLLLDFTPQYVEKTVAMLDKAHNQAMRVKLAFGRTLFHFDALRPEVEYSRDFILEAQRSGFVRSSWSNVVDLSSSHALTALLADLYASPRVQKKERLTVYLKFRHTRQKDLKMSYNLDEASQQWAIAKCKLNIGTRYALDTNFEDHVSVRARVFEKVDASAKQLETARRSLHLNSAVTMPCVELVDGSPLDGEGAVVEKAWRSRQIVVSDLFPGLKFKIIESVLNGELQLEVKRRRTGQESSQLPLGARFKRLLSRVQMVLAAYR